ncbi:anhydro-N-acetylmuramic acid kinase [mine drainage metagenome]|uniref:Anhydro-N-acetylmuramic acid kinase n=1 Tax=mine drainage metagenome TaxID=410659 RepID=A0A1J5RY83_9ZZZZ
MTEDLFIGLMSGTSLDGIDVALVDFNNDGSDPTQQKPALQTFFLPYPPSLRTQILALQHPTTNELEITELISNQIAQLYAEAVNQLLTSTAISANKIIAIGCHGQTIRHRPGFADGIGFTLQIGNAALLAELTNITVVADFRSRDIAAGGQGAPLVPAFHQAMFASTQTNRAIINIGGIANITYLGSTGEVFGFDSGPGNMLLDAWIKQHKGLDYDANGTWANSGKIIESLLTKMLAEPYFSLPSPKSTGRDLFNDKWLSKLLIDTNYLPEDVARTLVALTAHSIYDALNNFCNEVDEIYLCGGGAHNDLLIQSLQLLLDDKKLATTDALGVGMDWVEAIAFAWLARQCLHSKTASLPNVTGAKGARILGAIYQH